MIFGPINVGAEECRDWKQPRNLRHVRRGTGIPDNTRGAAPTASAVQQLRKLDIENRIDYSFITEDEFPGSLASQRKGPDHQCASKD